MSDLLDPPPMTLRRRLRRLTWKWEGLLRILRIRPPLRTIELPVDDCEHRDILECRRWDDGSIEGRCQDCGEEGFMLHDAAYEDWIKAGRP